jgi:phage terminase large subunit
VTELSTDLIKELSSYVWAEDKNGNVIDAPVKFQDHGCDAYRYGYFTHMGKREDVKVRII